MREGGKKEEGDRGIEGRREGGIYRGKGGREGRRERGNERDRDICIHEVIRTCGSGFEVTRRDIPVTETVGLVQEC